MEVIPYEQLRPSTDEKPIRDLQFMLTGGVATLVAYEMGLFSVLEAQSKTAAATAEALGVSTRAAQALLSICASVGFIEWTGEGYKLTAFGREYLVPSSPTY
jgi:methyltransferase family protein